MRTLLSVTALLTLSTGAIFAETLYAPGSAVGSSTNANVGIGTPSPRGTLEVAGSTMVHNGIFTHVTPELSAPANATDSVRFEIGRMGVNQLHWGNYGVIVVELFQTQYGAGAYQKWYVKAGYGDYSGSASLVERFGGNQYARIILGSPVVTGNSYVGYPNQYIPIYLDASAYTKWRVRVTHAWPTTENAVPEQSQLKFFAVPASSSMPGTIVQAPDAAPSVHGSLTVTGNVGIGTTNPTHKLSVNGTIKAKEVIVETTGWADDVFSPGYTLPTLDAVEQHIAEKGHLPGVPSGSEVAAEGVSIGDMQNTLLRKIEEMTLYMIATRRELAQVRSENAALRAEVEALKNRASP